MLLALFLAVSVTGLFGAIAAQSAPTKPGICPPVDESANDSDLLLFRARLQIAVAARDMAAVVRMADPKIRTSFGPDDGLESLKAKLADPRHEIWGHLARALALGGRFETPELFVAPYTAGCGDIDAMVIVGSNVNVRTKPSLTGEVIASLSYAVLRFVERETEGWTKVRLAGGRTGFVADEFLRSPIDYRAIFAKVDGRWRLSAFVAGD